MRQRTPAIPLVSWTYVGPWHQGSGAPNGSVPGGAERISTTFKVYQADYYGKGPKLYLDGKTVLHYVCQGTVCLSPEYGHFSDGNVERIAARLEVAGVSLPVPA